MSRTVCSFDLMSTCEGDCENCPPNPGSITAKHMGCTCPVLDNEHGRGIPWPREDGLDPVEHPSFYVNERCPLHGTKGHA